MVQQVWVKCTRCKRLFLRYDYGKGKRRVKKPHHGSRSGKRSCSVDMPCYHCGGSVERK